MRHQAANPASPIVEVSIEKMVQGGSGFARIEGKPCFIPGALPGETVSIRIESSKRQYSVASLLEVLRPSMHRIDPPCPVYGTCGGCQWQHMQYGYQLSCKADIVKDCLVRIGKFRDITVQTPEASPKQVRYRCRASLKVGHAPLPTLGLFREKTHELVPLEDCLLLERPLVQACRICQHLLRADSGQYSRFSQLHLHCTGDSDTVSVLWEADRDGTSRPMLIQADSDKAAAQHAPLVENLGGIRFLRIAGSFYQVNREQNLAMIDQVLSFMNVRDGASVLDMYCGCGNFSLFLAREGARITGLDASPDSIREAEQNAALNGIEGCRFHVADITTLDAAVFKTRYSGVLLNPPRSGCDRRALLMMAEAGPSVIVYVSCNPATLSRDLRILADHGYGIDAVQPFDMFPQTFHVETIVRLSK